MKTIAVILIALALTACVREPMSTSATGNAAFEVEFLFQHDECKVFRFYDGGRYHYFTKCPASSGTAGTQPKMCGKSQCPYPENVPTGYTP